MHLMTAEMRACIEECLHCHGICLGMAMNHCLEQGGKHVEPGHFRTMLACAEICQTAVNFMLIGTQRHRETCRICADVCEECAKSCEQVGGMEECVQVCRRCAESCRRMTA
jgi:hypothetical protein